VFRHTRGKKKFHQSSSIPWEVSPGRAGRPWVLGRVTDEQVPAKSAILPGAAAAARSSAAPCVDAPMAAQRCLDAIAATRRASGRDDAAPLDPAAPATDLRATHHVGDRPRHGRAAWHMASAAREPMLRPDAVLSAAAPPARVDVSRPLDPLRCSDLSYHVMLFFCFARFIRSLLFFRLLMTPCLYWIQTTPFGCQKTVRTSVHL
jgi:hypothetical protein